MVEIRKHVVDVTISVDDVAQGYVQFDGEELGFHAKLAEARGKNNGNRIEINKSRLTSFFLKG